MSALTLHVASNEPGSSEALSAAIKNDVILDAASLASSSAAGTASATRIVVKIASSAIIKFRVIGKKGVVEPLLKTQDFTSAAEFASFMQGKMMAHIRKGAREESVDAKTGKKKATQLPDEEIGGVIRLDAAVKAMQEEGTYLALSDPGYIFREEVSNLRGFRSNIASAFEEQSNKAIAASAQLLAACDGKLEALNDGRGVTFFDNATGQAFVQCDGLFKGTSVVLVNEAKTHLHEEDVMALVEKTKTNFEKVLASPSKYRGEPDGVLAQLAGLAPAYFASCKAFTVDAKTACESNGIHLIESDGTGFKCTMHGPLVAAAAPPKAVAPLVPTASASS